MTTLQQEAREGLTLAIAGHMLSRDAISRLLAQAAPATQMTQPTPERTSAILAANQTLQLLDPLIMKLQVVLQQCGGPLIPAGS